MENQFSSTTSSICSDANAHIRNQVEEISKLIKDFNSGNVVKDSEDDKITNVGVFDNIESFLRRLHAKDSEIIKFFITKKHKSSEIIKKLITLLDKKNIESDPLFKVLVDLEGMNKFYCKIYEEFRESAASDIQKLRESAASDIQKLYKNHLQKKISKNLENEIDLMEVSSRGRIDLSKHTFGKTKDQDRPVLGKEEIKQLANLDPARLSDSRYGGLIFDFKGADPEDIKKFLQGAYCADFRSCTIKNLDLEKLLEKTKEEEKSEILKNFSTVKFRNCEFDQCNFGEFKFRAQNIESSFERSAPKGINKEETPEGYQVKIREFKRLFGSRVASLKDRGAL